MKECNECHRTLPLESFKLKGYSHKYKSEISKRVATCRVCLRLRYANYKSPNDRWNNLAYNLRRHEGGNVTASQLKVILGEPSICYLCGGKVTWEDSELDHVIPLSQGGKTVISNLKWAHRRCNRIKHDLTIEELVEHAQTILNHLTNPQGEGPKVGQESEINYSLVDVKYFWHSQNGHIFTATCPDCLRRIRLVCGYNLSRAATEDIRLDGWIGSCPNCHKRYGVLPDDISKALATPNGIPPKRRKGIFKKSQVTLKQVQWKSLNRTRNSKKFFTRVHIYDTAADPIHLRTPTLCGETFDPEAADIGEHLIGRKPCKKCQKLAQQLADNNQTQSN